MLKKIIRKFFICFNFDLFCLVFLKIKIDLLLTFFLLLFICYFFVFFVACLAQIDFFFCFYVFLSCHNECLLVTEIHWMVNLIILLRTEKEKRKAETHATHNLFSR